MNKNMHLLTLIDMLRELDLEKNSTDVIRNILDYVAKELEEYID